VATITPLSQKQKPPLVGEGLYPYYGIQFYLTPFGIKSNELQYHRFFIMQRYGNF